MTPLTLDPTTEDLLARIAAVGSAAEADGWLELPPKITGALAMARSGGLINVCFDIMLFANMIRSTIRSDEQRARDFGLRYKAIDPAKARRLHEWETELMDIQRALTHSAQSRSNETRVTRESDRRASVGRPW